MNTRGKFVCVRGGGTNDVSKCKIDKIKGEKKKREICSKQKGNHLKRSAN
jgi:hypothetical protein